MIKIHFITSESSMWQQTIDFAENCSWRAGKLLAQRMRENTFKDYERVVPVRDNDKIVAFCTFSEKDELKDDCEFSPFVGFVFVDENYRGKRISEQMINSVGEYAKKVGFEKFYIVSGEIGLYEKYCFRKIGDFETVYGTKEQVFVRNTVI